MSTTDSTIPTLTDLANQTLAAIPKGRPVALSKLLPQDDLIPGTERLFCGPLSLGQIVRLGGGDVLKLGGQVFGLAGTYKIADGATETRLAVHYPDTTTARSVVTGLKTGLDTSYVLTEASSASFTFSGPDGSILKMELDGRLLRLTVRSAKR